MNLNKIISDIILGFKKGMSTPTLPQNTLNFINKPLIRIFRFIGGISFLTLIGRTTLITYFNTNISSELTFILIIITIFFVIFQLCVTIIRIRHMNKFIKGDDLDIRNSPLNKLASLFSRGLYCLKGSCENIAGLGAVFGSLLVYDQILENAGKERLITPIINRAIDAVTPTDPKVLAFRESLANQSKTIKGLKTDRLLANELSIFLEKDEVVKEVFGEILPDRKSVV